jgi:FKBP-type peptidyl-prolyl cis-trans isomerase FkpA
MKRIIPALLAVVLLASCNQYEKTPSGLKYKIDKGGSKETLKQGQFVKMNIEYRISPKDSVLGVSSFGHVPLYLMVDTSRPEQHSFLEIITMIAPGDKVEFLMSVDTLKNQGKVQYDNVFHARDMIKGKVEVLKTFASSAEAQADYQKELDLEKERELKALNEYAAKKGLKTQATASGALVVVENAGEPAKGDTGTRVHVLYTGSFEDGKVFESNADGKNPNAQPMTVDVGAGGMIKGLEEALKFFGKGGKGKVLIPAMLAYGQQGNPPVIPPYSNIIFDIQVTNVETSPAPQTAPGAMPQPQR